MPGHILSVKFSPNAANVDLSIVCLEQAGAPCRLICPAGCDQWDTEHEHELTDATYCNAVDWIDNCGTDECCHMDDRTEFSLHDGMPVEVFWVGGGYGWRPLNQFNDAGMSAAVSYMRQIMMATGGVTLHEVDKNCVPFARSILVSYFHEASRTVGPVP